MKFLIVALCVACASAVSEDKDAAIVRSDFSQKPDGGYEYNYETDNGIFGQAVANLKAVNKDEFALEVQGANQFQSPEGQVIKTTYVANEFGYQPQGDHLPTPPPPQPIPDYIQRSLEYIAAHPYVEKKN